MSRSSLRAIFERRMLLTFFLGFSSGLPLLATGSTLQAWMTDEKVDLKLIGLYSLVGLPYTCKFLWAPVMDWFVPPLLGRRRGWMLITQFALLFSFVALGSVNPASQPALTAFCAVCVAFCSASQDIVLDAHRRDTLTDEELGLGSSLFVNGYRIGMLMAGAFALSLADQVPWPMVYYVLGALMLIGMIATLFAAEPENVAPPKDFASALIKPFGEFFGRKNAFLVLGFIVLYKLGEVLASAMTTPFLLGGVGFTKTELAAIVKTFGLFATIGGGLTGGVLMLRLGLLRSLWVFGALQSIGLLGFVYLSQSPKSAVSLAAVVSMENFSSGMATAAFTAYLGSICHKSFSATQYALLSSFIGVPRVVLSTPSGYLAEQLGWGCYFLLCIIITLPGLLLLLRLGPSLRQS